jgi:hypothetical protein
MAKKKEKVQKEKIQEKKHDCKRLPWVLGILGAFYTILLALMSRLFGMGTPLVHIMRSLYLGYDTTFLGIVIGALWGFIDLYILGLLFEWLYHKL